MAPTVQTVTGPVDAADLGRTLVHEHVLLDMYEASLNSAGVLLDEPMAIDEVARFRDAGGVTLVDQTTLGLHPNLEGLRRISLATGVRIVAGTGLYWHRFRPAWVEALDEGALAARFIEELTVGSRSGGVRAGVIGEVATGHRAIDEVEARALRAAARAHLATGASIATHAIFTAIGLEQLAILDAAGVPPDRVVIGHADTNPSLDYQLAVLARGAWLGFDTVGQTDKASDDWRADRLRDLVDRGHLGRILVSSDVCKRPALCAFGGGGYAFLFHDFLPRLRARGFGDREIDALLVDNPLRWLAGA